MGKARLTCARLWSKLLMLVISSLLGGPALAQDLPELHEVGARNDRWAYFITENRIDVLLARLSRQAHASRFAITHVNILPMTREEVLRDQSVLVEEGKIVAVGPAQEVRVLPGEKIIDGTGKYLLPGLTDMHFHNLTSSSHYLLNLAEGVTTLRDMDGFAWTLRVRERVSRSELLAPNLYVAGTILNYYPMDWYARVVKTEDQARAAVREQKQQGYDFIKVHNNMPMALYRAILEEAEKLGIDVVGHVPHDVLVAQAVSLGQRTLEHLKGFYLDTTLTESSEDYVNAVNGATVWICPTFYVAARASLRGEEARRVLADKSEAGYISWLERRRWSDIANLPPSLAQQNILPMSERIFRKLLPVHPHVLAGTDTGGGYEFTVPGFALHHELEYLVQAGLSPYEALRAATVEPALAMRRETEFGTVEVGKRADLLLVRANPLDSVANLAQIGGVAIRGEWFSHEDLQSALRDIRKIYNPKRQALALPPPRAEDIEALVKSMRNLHSQGFVFRDHDLLEISELLNYAGRSTQSTEILGMRTERTPLAN
jgi:imidazolonepropionase-like amidohydrolase